MSSQHGQNPAVSWKTCSGARCALLPTLVLYSSYGGEKRRKLNFSRKAFWKDLGRLEDCHLPCFLCLSVIISEPTCYCQHLMGLIPSSFVQVWKIAFGLKGK